MYMCLIVLAALSEDVTQTTAKKEETQLEYRTQKQHICSSYSLHFKICAKLHVRVT